ncbi:MAG: hypothetical protein VYB72_07280 [Planctomycetota bacterium]|nr:hypothetical protein [Planctomycetota bacterium]
MAAADSSGIGIAKYPSYPGGLLGKAFWLRGAAMTAVPQSNEKARKRPLPNCDHQVPTSD